MVEIAPAFGLDEGMRQQLHSDAVRLVKHVGYRNAGALSDLRVSPCCCFPSPGGLARDCRLGLCARRHGGVHGGQERGVLLPGGQPAHPGGRTSATSLFHLL